MKERLNLTIDEALIEEAKKYARKHHISLSQMVEKYLKQLLGLLIKRISLNS